MIHRGYDSAGALTQNNLFKWHQGLTNKDIYEFLDEVEDASSSFFMGHNRWATHGKVNLDNAHPIGNSSSGYLVHNGTISNLESFKQFWTGESDTVLAHEIFSVQGIESLEEIEGDNVFIFNKDKDFWIMLTGNTAVYYSRKNGLEVICSEIYPLLSEGFSNIKVIECKGGHMTINFETLKDSCYPTLKLDSGFTSLKKTTMLEEIYEQRDFQFEEPISFKDSVHFIGCGSSYHAGLFIKEYGQAHLQTYNTKCSQASLMKEMLYHKHTAWYPDEEFFFLSQSGESKDVIDCCIKADYLGLITSCLTNNYYSSLNRLCKNTYNLNCTTEYAVAATKTFTKMCLSFMEEPLLKYWHNNVYGMIKQSVNIIERMVLLDFDKIFFFGTGTAYPIALESSLKVQEVANVPSWAMPSNEVKHGPIALIDKRTLCVFCNSLPPEGQDANSNQVSSRGATTLWLHKIFKKMADEKTLKLEPAMDLLNVIFAQLLSYSIAKEKGLNPDMPINLAKTVTV